MSKQKPEYAGITWADVAQNVGEYEATLGVRIRAQVAWEPRLSAGAYVEVIIFEGGTVGVGPELVRVRQPFPTKKGAGHAGAVMWAVASATRDLEANPWQWSAKMRRAAHKTA